MEKFIPSRGIRVGDPLSPYLFFTCMERFNQVIEKAIVKEEYSLVRMLQT